MSYRNRNSTGATKTVHKPKIFWDSGRDGFCVITPTSAGSAQAFKNQFQVVCGSAQWLGNEERAWLINTADLEGAKIVLRAHFGEDYDFVDKPDENQKPLNGAAASTAAEAALTMFQIGGYESARKVYSTLIRAYHPDINPDPEAHHKAASITLAWKRLKTELGWS